MGETSGMPVAPAASASPPDSLAVAPARVVRSRLKMDSATDTQVRLKRAKERLYVLCQLVGWTLFMIIQVLFARLNADPADQSRSASSEWCGVVMVTTIGLLLTHFARSLMTRWGWKELGWRALLPRLLLMAAVLALIWMGSGFIYAFGILGRPWPAKYSPGQLMFYIWFNSAWVQFAWLSLYTFYHIFDRLNRLQVEQLQLAASVKEAELRALKSQVNPHFLFNSLNSLRALIDEDAPRAREAVTRLANMLRYSLQSGQQETVPFDEEIRIVEDYLALEQIRHESRLRVRWEIAAETRLFNVPPMLLQTLVENAVKYGIGTRREGGELVISARTDGAALNIRVSNPGDLAAPTSAAAARAGSSTGVGLRNASERLKLLFGERAVLTLLAEPAGCVTADVVIPLNPAVK
jgi:hypothetical protein